MGLIILQHVAVQEGLSLLSHGVSPYNGDSVHEVSLPLTSMSGDSSVKLGQSLKVQTCKITIMAQVEPSHFINKTYCVFENVESYGECIDDGICKICLQP